MIRKLADLVRGADLRVLVAVGLISYGVSKLQALVQERSDELLTLDAAIADRTARLRELQREIGQHLGAAEAAPYPAREDVDPLDRGEPVDELPAAHPVSGVRVRVDELDRADT